MDISGNGKRSARLTTALVSAGGLVVALFTGGGLWLGHTVADTQTETSTSTSTDNGTSTGTSTDTGSSTDTGVSQGTTSGSDATTTGS